MAFTFCTGCGRQFDDEDNFCPYCGTARNGVPHSQNAPSSNGEDFGYGNNGYGNNGYGNNGYGNNGYGSNGYGNNGYNGYNRYNGYNGSGNGGAERRISTPHLIFAIVAMFFHTILGFVSLMLVIRAAKQPTDELERSRKTMSVVFGVLAIVVGNIITMVYTAMLLGMGL